MNKHFKLKLIMGMTLLISVFSAGVYAADGIERIEATLRPDYQIKLDNKLVTLDQSPLVYEGTTYLPLRSLANLLELKIGWDQTAKTVSLTRPVTAPSETTSKPNQKPNIVGEMKLDIITTFRADYKGNYYYILSTVDYNNVYYRAKDIERIGIDLGGVRAYQEILTKDLYIAENDLNQLWKDKPAYFEYYNEIAIQGEDDLDKIRVLKEYFPPFNPNIHDPYDYYSRDPDAPSLVCYIADKMTDQTDRYLYLCQNEKDEFFGYEVTLRYDELNEKWRRSSSSGTLYIDPNAKEEDEEDIYDYNDYYYYR